MLLIFILKRVTESIQPCGTPISCTRASDRVLPTLTRKSRSFKKAAMKMGRRPLRPKSCKSLKILYFQVVSYALSRSKNTDTTCCLFINASRINVSKRTR